MTKSDWIYNILELIITSIQKYCSPLVLNEKLKLYFVDLQRQAWLGFLNVPLRNRSCSSARYT